MTIDHYNKDWAGFEKYIQKKVKGRCELTSKNWLKLRDYHFEHFILKVPRPYGLLFKMIHMSKVHKQIPCIYRFYHKYKRQRQQELFKPLRPVTRAAAYRKYR